MTSSIESYFLEKFISTIILEKAKKESLKISLLSELQKKDDEIKAKQQAQKVQTSPPIPAQVEQIHFSPADLSMVGGTIATPKVTEINEMPKIPSPPKMIPKSHQSSPMHPNAHRLQQPPQRLIIGEVAHPTNEESILGKLQPYLVDRAIRTIECPGPGKPVILNKSGFVQTSPISLTSEEIDGIMKTISEKTKIPLTTGLFTGKINDLFISAVISEFAGTRFIIQKK
jgi:hypothetical protein